MYFLPLFFGNLTPIKRDIAPINRCICTRKTWNGICKFKFAHSNRVSQLTAFHCNKDEGKFVRSEGKIEKLVKFLKQILDPNHEKKKILGI